MTGMIPDACLKWHFNYGYQKRDEKTRISWVLAYRGKVQETLVHRKCAIEESSDNRALLEIRF
jgi:hypothetical protein